MVSSIARIAIVCGAFGFLCSLPESLCALFLLLLFPCVSLISLFPCLHHFFPERNKTLKTKQKSLLKARDDWTNEKKQLEVCSAVSCSCFRFHLPSLSPFLLDPVFSLLCSYPLLFFLPSLFSLLFPENGPDNRPKLRPSCLNAPTAKRRLAGTDIVAE